MQDEEGGTVRYENKETEGRGCREMVEIDCSTGPRHNDFIYYIPTSLTFTWYFQNARYDGNSKQMCLYETKSTFIV